MSSSETTSGAPSLESAEPTCTQGSALRAGIRFAAFALLCAIVVPVQSLILCLHKGRWSYPIPHLWHRGVCAIFGLSATIKGRPVTDAQVMYLSNHISYLDIPLLAAVIEKVSFVAKSEVEGWPVFGFLSKLQQTAFISRQRSDTTKASGAMETLLDAGKNLAVFPEGTSTPGTEVLPFKSSLFALPLQPQYAHVLLQPVTIRLLSVNGRAVDSPDARDLYAWHRDMTTELPAHLWRFAKQRGARLEIIFHPPVAARDFTDRKALAKTCCDAVSRGLNSPLNA